MKTKDMERERLQGQPQGQPQEQTQRSDRLTTADVARAASAGNHGDSRREIPALERGAEAATPLFPSDVANDFRMRWTDVQTGFVDTPREAVERADELVADAIKRLANTFAQERSRLEAQWARDGDVSTEDLRIALQRYRSFFERLLNV
jgi:hypothetical protein